MKTQKTTLLCAVSLLAAGIAQAGDYLSLIHISEPTRPY